MPVLQLKPAHKPVVEYYTALKQLSLLGISNEMGVKAAFQHLLEHCAGKFGWTLVQEWEIKRAKGRPLRVDGALVDDFRLTHGFWEAKDSHDDLAKEVRSKLDAGYPSDNILFQAPERAILWQNGRLVLDEDITRPEALVDTLKAFTEYLPPAFSQWESAVEEFQRKVPELAQALVSLIERERQQNAAFIRAFSRFASVCRGAINPNLSEEAVEEMLIQHLLTERIFRTVFDNPDFARRNAIAAEIEKVIDALTSMSFSRNEFLKKLDRFYGAIELTAATIEDFAEKQHFLNRVYEKFFQGFSVKVADTHGIVYTPQPIVDFMVRSVESVLDAEFGKSLSDPNVHILDPFVGTGNFIVRVMRSIKRSALEQKYGHELHCNEVMLLPYYIASMNIEHEYVELMRKYAPFEGACLVDTFELAEEAGQLALFTEENTIRVAKQRNTPLFVILGNPPYNAWQLDENDKNRNRKYPVMDRRIADTYAKDSTATLVNSLSDPYIKAIRWASDRLRDEGIVAFVTNNGFVTGLACDGVRKHLEDDFDAIYVLDLGGNVRKNPKAPRGI
jgi:predicted helicase